MPVTLKSKSLRTSPVALRQRSAELCARYPTESRKMIGSVRACRHIGTVRRRLHSQARVNVNRDHAACDSRHGQQRAAPRGIGKWVVTFSSASVSVRRKGAPDETGYAHGSSISGYFDCGRYSACTVDSCRVVDFVLGQLAWLRPGAYPVVRCAANGCGAGSAPAWL